MSINYRFPPTIEVDASPLRGDGNDNAFVAIHRDRLDRLERVLVWLEQVRVNVENARYDLTPSMIERADELLWGIPCRWCGCAESMCCCAQEETP